MTVEEHVERGVVPVEHEVDQLLVGTCAQLVVRRPVSTRPAVSGALGAIHQCPSGTALPTPRNRADWPTGARGGQPATARSGHERPRFPRDRHRDRCRQPGAWPVEVLAKAAPASRVDRRPAPGACPEPRHPRAIHRHRARHRSEGSPAPPGLSRFRPIAGLQGNCRVRSHRRCHALHEVPCRADRQPRIVRHCAARHAVGRALAARSPVRHAVPRAHGWPDRHLARLIRDPLRESRQRRRGRSPETARPRRGRPPSRPRRRPRGSRRRPRA